MRALPEALQRLGLPEILAYQQIFVVFITVGVICLARADGPI